MVWLKETAGQDGIDAQSVQGCCLVYNEHRFTLKSLYSAHLFEFPKQERKWNFLCITSIGSNGNNTKILQLKLE